MLGILCLPITTNAQQYAIPFGGNFTSQATGNQLGHLQSASGTFGSVSGNGQWIGLGLPSVGPAAYGMRIQSFNRFCTLNIRNGKSEIFWGGGTNNDFTFNYSANGTTPTPYMKILSNGSIIMGANTRF